jgi:hypothetical protein
LKQQAIDLLLNEREQIDRELSKLGHGDGQIKKRRGRPPNIQSPQEKAPEP